MDMTVAREVLRVFRTERRRRLAALPDHADAADDQVVPLDEPFVNELCLMLLVAVRHQVEEGVGRAQCSGHSRCAGDFWQGVSTACGC